MEAECRELGGVVKWTYRIETDELTELEPMAAFVGGAKEDPRLMLYCSGQGLKALDWRTGDVVWSLSERLGASISWAVEDDGTMYIGGYYGPDPVCVGNDGEVIWRSRSGSDDIYWLTEIKIGRSGLGAFYEVFPKSETGGWVVYDWDGTVKKYKEGN